MPIYQYQCHLCGKIFDEFAKVGEYNQERTCRDPKCRGLAIKIISARGHILSDTPSWLDDHVQNALLDTDSKNFRPIESRTELKRHMKQNGICEAPKSGPRWI